MKYGYVCTNFNNSRYTIDAVASLNDNTRPPSGIVVVDNASRPDAVEPLIRLAEETANVDVLLNPDNSGYFKGLNLGIHRIRETHPDLDCLVIGNNDLVFPPDFGDRLARRLPQWADHPVVSPDVVTLDGLHQNPHVIHGVSRMREFVYDLYYANYYLGGAIRKLAALSQTFTDRADEAQYDREQFITQGHGSVYILTPKFFEMFNELWAPTFLMGEEYFLSYQLEEKGKKVFYDPQVVVQHHCNGAIKNIASRKMWELSRDAHKVYRQYVKVWG